MVSQFTFISVQPPIWFYRTKFVQQHQHRRQLMSSKPIKPAVVSLIITCELRTCRNCKQSFDPSKNNKTACQYHDGYYTGDSKRKGEWNNTYQSGSGTAERFWWCCGENEQNAPGCRIDIHKSYDDE